MLLYFILYVLFTGGASTSVCSRLHRTNKRWGGGMDMVQQKSVTAYTYILLQHLSRQNGEFTKIANIKNWCLSQYRNHAPPETLLLDAAANIICNVCSCATVTAVCSSRKKIVFLEKLIASEIFEKFPKFYESAYLILSHINAIHALHPPSWAFNIIFHFTLPSKRRNSKKPLSFRFPHQILVCISLCPYNCRIFCMSYLSLLCSSVHYLARSDKS